MNFLNKRLFVPILIALLALQGCGCKKQPNEQVGSSPELTGSSSLPGGEKGETGEPGANGKDGIDGADGINGRDGIDGTNGRDGIEGKAGTDGEKGETGGTGPKGEKGNQGLQGQPGRDGNDGVGIQGAQGIQGIQGPAGPTGPQGPEGPQGPAGTAASEPDYPWELPPAGTVVTVGGLTYTYNGNWWDCEDDQYCGKVLVRLFTPSSTPSSPPECTWCFVTAEPDIGDSGGQYCSYDLKTFGYSQSIFIDDPVPRDPRNPFRMAYVHIFEYYR